MKKILYFFIIILFVCVPIYAHPGRLDSNGGHYDRSTGEYHYHDGSHSGQSQTYNKNYNTVNNEVVINTSKNITNNTYSSNTKQNLANNTSTNYLYEDSKETPKEWFKKHWLLTIILIAIALSFGLSLIFTIKDFIETIIDEIKEKKNKNNIKPIVQNNYKKNSTFDVKKYICPKCGSFLKVKTGRYGKFIGCSNYPNCKYTKKYIKGKNNGN